MTLTALDDTPDARVVPLPGAGHFANLEQPERSHAILAASRHGAEMRGRDDASSGSGAAEGTPCR